MEPSADRVTVRSGSVIVADTVHALVLREASYPPVFYIPLDDVERDALTDSGEHSYCPYKGEASYFDLADGTGGTLPAAVWYYDAPYPAVADIARHVAFYPDRVTIDTAVADN